MSVLIKTRSSRFTSVNLQNKDAKSFTFKEINKLGCLNGYIRGVVYKRFPVFEHCLYGKLLKMILIDKNDDADNSSDDDDDAFQYPELSFFTRGQVAELCSTIRKGDVIVLEQPFVERLYKENPVYHLAGDKRLSDISVWVLRKRGPVLLVKGDKTEEASENPELVENDEIMDSVEEVNDLSNEEQPSPSILPKKRILRSKGQNPMKSVENESEEVVDLSNEEQPSPSILPGKRMIKSKGKNSKKSVGNESEDFAPVRATRSASLPTNSTSKDSRVTRSTKDQDISKSPSSSTDKSQLEKTKHDKANDNNKSTSKPRKNTSSAAARGLTTSENTNDCDTEQSNKSIKSPMVLRNKEKLNEKGTLSKSKEKFSLCNQNTRNGKNQEQKDKGLPVAKKQKRKLFGPKGVSSTPKENPKIHNVVLENVEMKPCDNVQSTSKLSDQTTDDDLRYKTQKRKKSDPDQSKAKTLRLRHNLRSHLKPPNTVPSSESSDDEITFKSQKNKMKSQSSANTSSPSKTSKTLVQTRNAVLSDEETSESIQPATPSGIISAKRKSLNSGKNEVDASNNLSPRKSPRLHEKSLKNATSDNLSQQVQVQLSNTVNSDIEMSQESNDSQPATPSGLLQINKQRLASKHNQRKVSPSSQKSLRSSNKVSRRVDEVLCNAEAKGTAQSSNSISSDESTQEREEDSQTSSQRATPSGMFHSKKILKPRINSGYTEVAESQLDDMCTAQNAPSTSTAPNTATTQNVSVTTLAESDQRTSNFQKDPSTSTAQSTPNTAATTQNVQDTTSADSAPSTSNSQNATDTSTSNNMPINSNTLRDSYQVPSGYTKLSNLQLNTAVNLYGVVKYFKPPWKSRGTDMCSVVVLADPSTDDHFECVMFNKDAALLPQVRRMGDIVRLHRVNVKKYQDKFQGLSARGFSSIVFDRDVTLPVTQDAARFSSATFTFSVSDINMVKTLKEWRISQESLFEPAKILTVSEVEPDLYFDLVCQVKGLSKQTNLDCVCLTAIDGTHPQYDVKKCDDDDGYTTEVPFDPNLCQFTTFDIFLYGDHAMLLLNMKVSDGSILMLHNVHCTVVQGGPGVSLLDVVEPTIELLVHRGSEYGRGLSILHHDSSDAQKLLQRLKTAS